ncbi:Ead protein [Salmonella enterica subsp. enterica serovar Oslo]|nr:ead/Ea22-like family protein [Salmonella enterica subsp. enterica serovar Potsdam]EBU9249703.1 Ead protein [Salmonella enterica subsp. enterica serovar Oslo]ECG3167226.1 ead/Ea22-like family protein [Salmonella enterica subsp. enterica serovar Potsdam]EDV4903580.1 ead/Ea22-like family protein [Salmonella enterica subsp. enterica]
MTIDKRALREVAERATPGNWRRTSSLFNGITVTPFSLCGEEVTLAHTVEKRDAEFIAAANPATMLALLDELEHYKSREERVTKLVMDNSTSWDALYKKLEAAEKRIAEQSAIVAAAEKLVRCKGRYHSELNYRALAKLFGVVTPDLPPLEHENVHYADAAEVEITALRQRIAELEAREVVLPPRAPENLASCLDGYGNWVIATTFRDTWNACLSEVVRMNAAGIGVKQQDSVDSDVGSRNQPGMVVAVHIDAGDFVKVKGQVFEVEETDFDDHDVTLWFVGGNALKCAAGCPVEVVSAPVAAGIKVKES